MRKLMKNEKVMKIVYVGLFAALSYVVFTFLQIKITLPGGDATSIHLGNAVCVTVPYYNESLWAVLAVPSA